LNSEFTRDEILKDYSKLKNADDLFDSDVLILQLYETKAFGTSEILEMKKEYEDLKIKCYIENQTKLKDIEYQDIVYCPPPDISDIIYLGTFVISTLSGLITIGDFLLKKYGVEAKRYVNININIFNKSKNNTYILHKYEGNVYNFYIEEMDKMREDLKNH